jgi:hypothetical protein
MDRNKTAKRVLLLAVLLVFSLVFSGCAGKDAGEAVATGKPEESGEPAAETGLALGNAAAEDFAAAFKTVDRNPLDESIQYALWLSASNSDEASGTAAGASEAMAELVGKYQAIVADQGLHYVEVTDSMGFSVETEVWIRGDKFKKFTALLNEVELLDGTYYIKYSAEDKTGTRFSPSVMTSQLTIYQKGMLASLAASPYEQQEDQNFGEFDCSVFYYDSEMEIFEMNIKGSTLFVDKDTGMLVRNVNGDPADPDNSVTTYVKSLEVGTFGDEVFTVPEDIVLEDY